MPWPLVEWELLTQLSWDFETLDDADWDRLMRMWRLVSEREKGRNKRLADQAREARKRGRGGRRPRSRPVRRARRRR